jgi:hypothetical protein
MSFIVCVALWADLFLFFFVCVFICLFIFSGVILCCMCIWCVCGILLCDMRSCVWYCRSDNATG